jgi:hypothetical protein
MGSIRDDGKAGTGCSSSSNCRKSFDDQAARASYVDGAPNPITAPLLTHPLSHALPQRTIPRVLNFRYCRDGRAFLFSQSIGMW